MNSTSTIALQAGDPVGTGAPANDNDLIIDLFAGGGGASTAIEEATGRSPDIAVNHDAEALTLHEANHPLTLHLCDDIRQVNIPSLLTQPRFAGRRVGLLWASPDCKDHSKAKGGVPKDKNIRGLAWEVLRWCAAIRRTTGAAPAMIALENVEEFQDWGPLHRYGKKANTVNKARRKETFRIWCDQLRNLGAEIAYWELVAADFGAPTTRKRLFLIARFDGLPITRPAPTHGKLVTPAPARGKKAKPPQGDLFDDLPEADIEALPEPVRLLPYRTAAQIIDWSLKVPSIFGRLKDLAPKTMSRIARGIDRFVIQAARPFIIPVNHSQDSRVYSADEPFRTATTAPRGDFQVVAPTIFPLTHQGDVRVHSLEDPTRAITAAHRGELAIGGAFLNRTDMQSAYLRNGIRSMDNAVPTITTGGGIAATTAFMVPRYGERPGQEPRALSIEKPAPTVVPDGNGGSLANVFMQKMSENGVGYVPDTPLHTAMAGAPRHYEVAAYLGRQFGTSTSGHTMEEPHPTVMSNGGGGKSQVITAQIEVAHIQRQFGRSIGSNASGPLGTIMASGSGKTAIITATLVGMAHGDGWERPGLRAWSMDESLRAVTASNDKALITIKAEAVTGFMAQGNGDRIGRSVLDPITTLTERSTQQQAIVPMLDKYYATGVAQTVDRPIDALTTKARFSLSSAFIEQANTGMVGHDLRTPVSTLVAGGTSGWGTTQRLIEVACAEIGAPTGSRRRAVLEFLWAHFGQPSNDDWADPTGTMEARRRFGLVLIDGQVWQIVDIGMRMLTPRELYNAQGFPSDYKIDIQFKGKPMTKTAQTRMAGNSVSPPPATALLKANLPERMLLKKAA